MDVNPRHVVERDNALYDFSPLEEIDPTRQKFPCCVVWAPLPVVSWIVPFFGHAAICLEDGTIVDFTGGSLIQVGHLTFGDVAKYYQIDRQQCCFVRNLCGHTCNQSRDHAEFGAAASWDEAVQLSTRKFEHRNFNYFICNGFSFTANNLNRLCYRGSMHWNMINIGALMMFKGKWVDGWQILRSFLPTIVVLGFGVLMNGWSFPAILFFIYLLIGGWFVFITYCLKGLLED